MIHQATEGVPDTNTNTNTNSEQCRWWEDVQCLVPSESDGVMVVDDKRRSSSGNDIVPPPPVRGSETER